MATMDDIAKSLGISKGTVSKALSGAEDISEAMRKAVLERAVELGYTRSKRGSAAKRVCVFVLHMLYENPDDFGFEIIVGFRKLAEPMGFQVDIIPLDEKTQQSGSYDEYMLRHGYLGALFLGLNELDSWKKDIQLCRTPTVLYDNPTYENPVVTQIGVDNIEAMHKAVSHLISLGHRRVGYLSSGDPHSFIYAQRRSAFVDAMAENHLPCDSFQTGTSPYTADCIRDHLPRLLEQGCTAIVCNHDLLAHAVITHCAELGIRIPEDLSVIGFDDIALCQAAKPAITTIRQNRTELGKSAFYALNSQMGHTPIGLLMLHAELILRESTGPAKSY